MIHVHTARNSERATKPASGAPVQVGTARHTSTDREVRARYDIEAESAWLTLFLAGVSVGCVIAVGIMKMLGAR